MSVPVDDPSRLRYVAGVDQQAGILAWSEDAKERRFWIVTSRRTRRWVLPKGSVDAGMTPAQAAAQEALEEAGLIGVPGPDPVGSYRLPKIRPPLIWTVQVALFAMHVDEVHKDWQESHQRERKLVTVDEAASLIIEPEIVALIRNVLPGLGR